MVGNPPFIGAAHLRRALGDGYVDAVRAVWKDVPESADFVMYWWHRAAEALRAGTIQRFGFITTNSIRQTFNRRVVEAHLHGQSSLSLVFAIPDHPWVDASDGVAVRIAMTVAEAGEREGVLQTVRWEADSGEDTRAIELTTRQGWIHADLTAGANVAGAVPLAANSGIASRGVQLIGAGFIVTPEVARMLAASGGPQRPARRRRSSRPHPLVASGLPASYSPFGGKQHGPSGTPDRAGRAGRRGTRRQTPLAQGHARSGRGRPRTVDPRSRNRRATRRRVPAQAGQGGASGSGNAGSHESGPVRRRLVAVGLMKTKDYNRKTPE